MPDVAAALGRRYGPLPGYGWVAIVGVGGGLYLRHRRSTKTSAGSSSPAVVDASTAAGEQTAYGTGYGDGYTAGGSMAGYTTPGAAADFGQLPAGPATAIVDPSTSTATSTSAMPGVDTTAPLAAAKATTQPTPQPAPARPARKAAKPKPKRTGAVTRRKPRVVVVHRGDTLAAIARREKVSLQALEKANPNLKRGPHGTFKLGIGERVTVP